MLTSEASSRTVLGISGDEAEAKTPSGVRTFASRTVSDPTQQYATQQRPKEIIRQSSRSKLLQKAASPYKKKFGARQGVNDASNTYYRRGHDANSRLSETGSDTGGDHVSGKMKGRIDSRTKQIKGRI